MKTILVWFLVSNSGNHSGFLTYSPPFQTLQECERVGTLIPNEFRKINHRCIQMEVVK